MFKILILTTSLNQQNDSHSMRVKSLIEGLNYSVNDLTIITTEKALIGFELKGVRCISVGTLFFEKLQNFINKNYVFKQFPILKSIIFRIFGFISLPDYTFDYYFKARKVINDKIDISNVDLIVSTSGGLSTHLVGRKIKCKNEKIKFVMDFGDPWSSNPLPPLSYKHISYLNKILEFNCYKKASLVLVTNDSFKKELQVLSSKYNFKLGIVPCGFENLIGNVKNKDCLKINEEVIIGYIGTASSSRDFTSIISHFKNVVFKFQKKLKFVLAGSISEHILNKVESECDNLKYYGWLSSLEAAKLQDTCDVLILPGNNSENQVPGKVYSYLYSNAIIVYMGHKNLKIDPTWEVLKNYDGVVRVFFNEVNFEVEKELYTLLFDERLTLALNSRKEKVERYKWCNISRQFETEIFEVR